MYYNIYYYCLKTLSPKVILTKMTLTILTKMTTILVLTDQVDNTKAFCTIEGIGVDEMATP